MMNRVQTSLIVLIAFVVGGLFSYFFLSSDNQQVSSESGGNKPLYWVAPMDPNFKRDQPGKSPMGMDLIPVYEESSANDSPGTVKINPSVINNMGVKTAKAKYTLPSQSIIAFGRIEFAEDRKLHIHPRLEGWVEKLHVRSEGEFIQTGEALYTLYSPELLNAQEEFLLAIAQNNRALINAAQSRLQSLNIQKAFIDKLAKTKSVQREVTFYAPQSGYIDTLNIQQGFYVKPNLTLLSISPLDTVWMVAEINNTNSAALALGQKITIDTGLNDIVQYQGEIDYVYPTLSENSKAMQIRASIANPKTLLKPGMFVEARILTNNDNESEILSVPKQAVIRTEKQDRVVMKLAEGEFKSVEVELGRKFDNEIEILSGLEEGDEIVTSAQFLIDSESSISSDFKRMQSQDAQHTEDFSESAWTHATINEVMIDEGMLNLSHGELDAFNMMGMTMNFLVHESIDLATLKEDMSIHIEVVKTPSSMFQVNTIHIMDDDKGMMEEGHNQ